MLSFVFCGKKKKKIGALLTSLSCAPLCYLWTLKQQHDHPFSLFQEPSFTTHTIRADIERAMADGGASVGRLPQLGVANTFDPPAREPVYELIRSTRARLPLSVGPAAAVRRRAAAVSEASSSGHGSGGSNRTSADSERVVSPADSGTVTSPADEAPAAEAATAEAAEAAPKEAETASEPEKKGDDA